MKRIFLTTLTIFFLFSFSTKAVDLQEGLTYQQNTVIDLAENGISAKIPVGFKGILPQGSQFFLLSSPQNQFGFISVMITELNEQQALAQMSNPIEIESGIFLEPEDLPVSKKNILSGNYQTVINEMPMQSSIKTVIGGYGRSIVVISVYTAENKGFFEKAANLFVNSLKIYKPKQAEKKQAEKNSWFKQISGQQLVNFYTSSGFSEKHQLFLCSNGSFSENFDGGGATQLGSGFYQDAKNGKWTVNGNTLSLIYQDGGKVTYTMSFIGESLHLNGKKYFRTKNEYCD